MSLASVASRIQERNNALKSELATLDLLQSQYDDAAKCLEEEKRSCQKTRIEFLNATRHLHGLELEYLRMKEQTSEIDNSILELKSSIESIQNKTQLLQKKFDEEHAPLYASHLLSIDLLTKKYQSRLDRAQSKKRRREERLEELKKLSKKHKDEKKRIEEEKEEIRTKLKELDRKEEEEDEEIISLRLQIKSILAKKASLRSQLNEARDKLEKLKENRSL